MIDLQSLSVWKSLTAEQQTALEAASVRRTCPKGTVLHQGDADCTGLILVCAGQLRAYILSEDGREITLYRLFERDICLFSASCIMNSIQFEIMVEAEKDSEVLVIPAELYKRIMSISAPLANYTNEIMASRFSEVMWLLDQILWKRFDVRLAEFLCNEVQIEGTNQLRITHEMIGRHLGNPREVVTRMLKYFQNEGYVKLSRGMIAVCDELDTLLEA